MTAFASRGFLLRRCLRGEKTMALQARLLHPSSPDRSLASRPFCHGLSPSTRKEAENPFVSTRPCSYGHRHRVPLGCGIYSIVRPIGAHESNRGELIIQRFSSTQVQALQSRSCHGEVSQEDAAAIFAAEEEETVAGSGSIHLIVGPMFAGKTTALLQRVLVEMNAGRNVAVVKSDKDTRYELAAVVSHDGMKMPCWAVSSLANFRAKIGEEEYAKLDVIAIDEAQFFKDLCSFCQAAADFDGKTLVVAGLDGDYLRNRFGSILDLVPLADSVVKLFSRCELCGKPACFTFRKTDDRNKEVIGGADVYMPVCRQHYLSGQVAMETARKVIGIQTVVSARFSSMSS